jgi:hypothetical protein
MNVIDCNPQLIRPAFYLFAALFGIAVIVMSKINLDFKLPAKAPFKDVTSLLKNVELDLLLFAGFISGKSIVTIAV